MYCIIQFSQEQHWIDFRYAELEAVAELCGLNPRDIFLPVPDSSSLSPFLLARFPNEEAVRLICSRSVMIKAVYEIWTSGESISDVVASIQALPETFTSFWYSDKVSWSISIDAYGRSFTASQQKIIREAFSRVPFQGPVKLENPTASMFVLMDYSLIPKNKCDVFDEISRNVPCHFCRFICQGGMREELLKYSLKTRIYLGPTSLDTSLAFIMTNLAQVTHGSLVWDPFVGTASILISATHHGAICFGTDIDIRVLKGMMYSGSSRDCDGDTTTRNVWENFKAYNLPAPELLRLDVHLLDRHLRLEEMAVAAGSTLEGSARNIDVELFDAVITDPPYAIRAGAKKSGKRGGAKYSVDQTERDNHCPATQAYAVEEVMLDLLHNAAKMLKIGGTLSYLIPTTIDFELSDLPLHPCFEMIHLCVQHLSSRHNRHLVVLRKVHRYTRERETEFQEYRQRILVDAMSVDGGNGFAHLIKKLSTALASESLLNEAVAKNCNSRKSKLIEVLKQKKSGIHETQEHVYNYKEIAAHIVDQLMKNDSKIMRIGREELTDWYIETFGTDVNMDREVVSNIVKRMIEQHRILAECSVEGLSVDSARWTEIKTAWDSRDNSLKKQKKSSNRNTTTIRAQQF